ncbi:MAG: PHP domain-containing protein [Acidaminobacteraceae bacterium]
MNIYGDYHTHTIYSHGLGTIEDNVKAAIEIGLSEIAISDHGPGHMGFGIKRSKYQEMRDVIDELSVKYPNIKILLGLEANILDIEGNIDVDDHILELNDILLAGYHFGSKPTKLFRDMHMHYLNYRSGKLKDLSKLREINTVSIINAINKYKIDLITHPGAKGPVDITRIGEAAFKRGTALEINSSHGYLSVEQLKVAMKVDGLEYMINSDAHKVDDIGNFKKAIERAELVELDIKRIRNAK